MLLSSALFLFRQVRILNEAWVAQPADRPSFVQLTRTIRAVLAAEKEATRLRAAAETTLLSGPAAPA